jgi:hypothetical protein
MATEEKNEVDLNIEETQDGSAVVDLPEGMDLPEDDGSDNRKAAGGEVSGDEDDHPDDSEAVRAAKRARRRAKKDLIRKTNEEKDIRLQQLQRENEEFKRRLSSVERETKHGQIARIDKGIEDQNVRLEYAKMKLSEAVQAGDGDAMVEAQAMWNDAQAAAKELAHIRHRIERDANQPAQEAPPIAGTALTHQTRTARSPKRSMNCSSLKAGTQQTQIIGTNWIPACKKHCPIATMGHQAVIPLSENRGT